MKRQVCPNCGTVQPGERRYCVSCGERLDDNASEYIDSRLYFERKPWMNVVVAVLLVLAVGNIVLTVVYGNTHYVWVPFICAVWFCVHGGCVRVSYGDVYGVRVHMGIPRTSSSLLALCV